MLKKHIRRGFFKKGSFGHFGKVVLHVRDDVNREKKRLKKFGDHFLAKMFVISSI